MTAQSGVCRHMSSAGWLASKAPLAIATAAALVLAGCGSGSSSTSTSGTGSTASTAPTTKSTSKTTTPSQGAKKEQGQRPTAKPQNSSGSPATAPYHGSAPTDPNPLPNQGKKEAALGVPTSTGGDNSIQLYGTEAQSSDRIQAATTAKAYLEARAAGDWASACSSLAGPARAQLAAITKAKSCAKALGALTATSQRAAMRSAADIHVLSFRVKSAQGFLIYRDATRTATELPMVHEGGAWKVDAIAGSPLML